MRKQVERISVERPILEKLNQHPLFFAQKTRTTGSVLNGKYIKLPFGVIPGAADLLIFVGDELYGNCFLIECKAPKGKQSPVQKAYERQAAKRGIRYYLVSEASQIEEIMTKEIKIWQSIKDAIADGRK
jgi:hypothetical protein